MKRAISSLFVAFLMFTTLGLRAQEVAQNNVKPVINALETVSKLQPISFTYDKAWAEKLKLSTQTQYGFETAEAKSNVPQLISVQSKSYTSGKNATSNATLTQVDYERLIPLLVGSIKEQQQQIDALKREIKSLKAQNTK